MHAQEGVTTDYDSAGGFSLDLSSLFLAMRTIPVMGAKNHPRKNHSQALRCVV